MCTRSSRHVRAFGVCVDASRSHGVETKARGPSLTYWMLYRVRPLTHTRGSAHRHGARIAAGHTRRQADGRLSPACARAELAALAGVRVSGVVRLCCGHRSSFGRYGLHCGLLANREVRACCRSATQREQGTRRLRRLRRSTTWRPPDSWGRVNATLGRRRGLVLMRAIPPGPWRRSQAVPVLTVVAGRVRPPPVNEAQLLHPVPAHRLLVSLTAGPGLARLGSGARVVALISAAHAGRVALIWPA